MSKNQSRIYPHSSQSDDNNNNNRAPSPLGTCVETICVKRILPMLIVIIFHAGFLLLFSISSTIANETVFFHFVNASLTQFDLTTNNNNTLDYKFTVDINVTNPNEDHIRKIDYDGIEARAYYQDNRFDSVNLRSFHQDYKNITTILHTVFQGQSFVPGLGENSEISDRFYRDKSDGSFDIQVQVSLRIKYHNHYLSWIRKSSLDLVSPTIKCDLRRVPLFNASSSSINGSSSSNVSAPPNIGTSTTATVGGIGGGWRRFRTKECKVINPE